ncbi:MAG: hypothetical protein ACJ71T_01335 [Actinomycetales bacterium]
MHHNLVLALIVAVVGLAVLAGYLAIFYRASRGMKDEIARGDYDLKQSWLPKSVWDPDRGRERKED